MSESSPLRRQFVLSLRNVIDEDLYKYGRMKLEAILFNREFVNPISSPQL